MFANEELVTKWLNIISVDYANVVSEISCWTIQVKEWVSCGGGIEESPNWVVTSSITNNRHELILLSFPSLNYISILLVIWMFSKARETARRRGWTIIAYSAVALNWEDTTNTVLYELAIIIARDDICQWQRMKKKKPPPKRLRWINIVKFIIHRVPQWARLLLYGWDWDCWLCPPSLGTRSSLAMISQWGPVKIFKCINQFVRCFGDPFYKK